MFKISVPITKSARVGNKLIVEGYASDTTIDRDEERFAESAIQAMKDSILKGNVKIRLEHENKFYTNIGDWIGADVTDDNRLYVKGEIDTELSLGKDVEVLLNRGQSLELSVGGKVVDAIYEYSKELGRNIKTYLDVVLEEISILLTPSNYNTELGIAKSVDWSKMELDKKLSELPYTSKSKQLSNIFDSMEKIAPDVYKDKYGKDFKDIETTKKEEGDKKEETEKEDKMKTCLAELNVKVQQVFKDSECEICYDDCCSPYNAPLTIGDLSVLYKLNEIMSQVTLPSSEEVSAIYTEEYWTTVDGLGDECFIILPGGMKVMPHHNADYSVNIEWVLIRLKQLLDDPNWYSTNDSITIINHLYRHLKEFSMVKSATPIVPTLPHITKEEALMLKSTYEFMSTDSTDIPKTVSGETMKGKAIEQCAKVYEGLIANTNFNSLINKLHMPNLNKEENAKVETEVETKVTTPEVPGSTDKPGTEQPVKEEVKTETTEVSQTTPVETTPEVVETKNEEAEKENKSVTPAKETEESMKKGFEKSMGEMQKSVSDLEVKFGKAVGQVDELTKTVDTLAKLVEKMAETSMGRKGVHSYQALEKVMTGTDDASKAAESIITKTAEEKKTFAESYKEMKMAMESPVAA